MKTVKINLYTFEELSTEAQEKALKSYRYSRDDIGTHWQDENFESIKKVLEFFDVKIKNYSIDYSCAAGSFISWELNLDYDDEIKELSGARLYKFIHSNYVGRRTGSFTSVFDGAADAGRCLFTGYCADASIIEPVTNFLQRPTKNINFEDLINSMISAGLKYMEQDYDYQTSDEAIKEELTDSDVFYNSAGLEVSPAFISE